MKIFNLLRVNEIAVGEKEVVLVLLFFNDTATTEIYTLSLHDALPISWRIPGTAEPGGLPSLGSHRVGHD